MNLTFYLFTFTILTVVLGLHGFTEQGQPQGAREDVQEDNHNQEGEETRFGYAIAVSNVPNRPLPRPPPSPIPLNTVECYVCSDCPQVLANTTSKLCSYTVDPSKQSKCVVYAEQYRHMKKPWVIRGCASERGSCSDIRKAHSNHAQVVKLLYCNECEGNRCNTNSASLSLIDVTMAFFAMVVTPLIAKYTLS